MAAKPKASSNPSSQLVPPWQRLGQGRGWVVSEGPCANSAKCYKLPTLLVKAGSSQHRKGLVPHSGGVVSGHETQITELGDCNQTPFSVFYAWLHNLLPLPRIFVCAHHILLLNFWDPFSLSFKAPFFTETSSDPQERWHTSAPLCQGSLWCV